MKIISSERKRDSGFSLVELMIVIAIIALLIGVGIPAWQAMVKNGNETTAIESINTLKTCQSGYAGKHQGKFSPTFDDLIKTGCIEGDKFKGEKPVINGYIYSMKVDEPSGTKPAFWSINVDPQVGEGITATGNRHFYFDATLGTTKSTDENRPAKPDDPSI
jgi:prepilin-type N-terminal cleavage/methylation domain-containing protein